MVDESQFVHRSELYGEHVEFCASCGMPLGSVIEADVARDHAAAYTDDFGSLCADCERSIRSGELALDRIDDDEPLA